MVQEKIINIVSQYIAVIKSEGIVVDEVYVYGSYATGKSGSDSDIDVAIISSAFGKDRYEEGKRLRQLAWRIDPRIEPLPISTQSFLENDWVPIIHEIKTKGIAIKIAA